jgi:hypothetical protein
LGVEQTAAGGEGVVMSTSSTQEWWRQQSLEEASKILKERSDVERLVSIEAVAERLNTSAETIRRAWRLPGDPPAGHFMRRLVRHLCSIDQFESFGGIPDMIRALAESTEVLADARTLLGLDFDLVVEDEGYVAQIVLMGGRPRPTLRLILAAMYHELEHSLADPLGALIESFGREVVPPYDIRHLSALLNALCEGVTQRARVEEDRSTLRRIYVDAALATVMTWTRPVGSDATVSSRTSDLYDEGHKVVE